MGSFNHKCNFSQLPATCGDRIVVLVGVAQTKNIIGDENYFAPGASFTPISVPIRGKYNDYGGIEDVDRTPGVEALENFFGLTVEQIVETAERTALGAEDQVKKEYTKIREVLSKICEFDWKHYDLEISYVMEHEAIFDKMIAMNDIKIKDNYYFKIPDKVIEGLGYTKTVLENETHCGREVSVWKHDSLPELTEKGYVWKTEDVGDYGKTTHTIADFCKYIGCEVPKEYNSSYFKKCFLNGVKELSKKDDSSLFATEERQDYSFLRWGERGLFSHREGSGFESYLIASLGKRDRHMDIKYMREVIEVALLYKALRTLEMTWGTTNSYRQDVDYDVHIDFLKNCLAFAKAKKKEYDCD